MRQDREWSQQQGFEALREGLHLGPKSRASYIAIDMGHRQPTVAEQAFLVSYFGKSPDDLPISPDPNEESLDLIKALSAQTEAINRLVDRLESLASQAIRDGVADELRAVGLAPASVGSPVVPPPGPRP